MPGAELAGRRRGQSHRPARRHSVKAQPTGPLWGLTPQSQHLRPTTSDPLTPSLMVQSRLKCPLAPPVIVQSRDE